MFGSLPNMTGLMKLYAIEFVADSSASGVFLDTVQENEVAQQTSGNAQGNMAIDFKASNGSSVYSGQTVQPAALQCLVCIKV